MSVSTCQCECCKKRSGISLLEQYSFAEAELHFRKKWEKLINERDRYKATLERIETMHKGSYTSDICAEALGRREGTTTE